MYYKIFEAKISLESLTVYRNLMQDTVVKALLNVFDDLVSQDFDFCKFINDYSDFYYKLVEYHAEYSFKNYLIEKIIFSDNSFSRYSEDVDFDLININLIKAVESDLSGLSKTAGISSADIKRLALEKVERTSFEYNSISALPEWESSNKAFSNASALAFKLQSCDDWKAQIRNLAEFYKRNGSGDFAVYKGFVWERNAGVGSLRGVVSYDPVKFSDFIGYEDERGIIIKNTLQFLNGHRANNVLLYGDRGTGKSSTIKALLNEYHHLGLRIIELPKEFLSDLHDVLRAIKGRQQKFIIFIDDLAFGDNEENYTALKAVLEGSLESKPENVIIYATSNRRHLIKEKFSDRAGLMSMNSDDEVRAADTMQEKMSLADRFGITVTFTSPDQAKYLNIVEGIAKSRNLTIDLETLRREAKRWEMRYNGRSARTARQFVDWVEALDM